MNFLERTDRLAKRLHVSVRGVAQSIGISEAALFAYRSGKNTVSDKAWRKLVEAEQRAGLLERTIGASDGPDLRAPGIRVGSSLVAEAKNIYGEPSSRQDCEEYFRRYLDSASADGDPNAFPFIMRLLKKHFPFTEWEKEELKSQG